MHNKIRIYSKSACSVAACVVDDVGGLKFLSLVKQDVCVLRNDVRFVNARDVGVIALEPHLACLFAIAMIP